MDSDIKKKKKVGNSRQDGHSQQRQSGWNWQCVCMCVWNYVEVILTGTRNLLYDGTGHDVELERYFSCCGGHCVKS